MNIIQFVPAQSLQCEVYGTTYTLKIAEKRIYKHADNDTSVAVGFAEYKANEPLFKSIYRSYYTLLDQHKKQQENLFKHTQAMNKQSLRQKQFNKRNPEGIKPWVGV